MGVLLPDVSVKMEFIDFLQPRIKQNCEKNITTTSEKYVIGIDYAQPSSPFTRMPAWSMSWFWPICPEHGDRDYDQGIILVLDVSYGEGRDPEETSQGRFSGQNR